MVCSRCVAGGDARARRANLGAASSHCPFVRCDADTTRRIAADVAIILVGVAVIVANIPSVVDVAREAIKGHCRHMLFAELQPARLANCSLARFGSANDGSYALCDNLLSSVASAYSYGIEGRDQW